MKIAALLFIGTTVFSQLVLAERLVCQTVIKKVTDARPLVYEIEGNNVILQNSNTYRILRQTKAALHLNDPSGRYSSISKFNFQGRVVVDRTITKYQLPFPCPAVAAVGTIGCDNLTDYLLGGGDRASGNLVTYSITNLLKPTKQANATLTIKFPGKASSSSLAAFPMKCNILK